MSGIERSDIDLLRETAAQLRLNSVLEVYGFCSTHDPRDFHPDPECSTDEERALHAEHCAAWNRGERPTARNGCEWTVDHEAGVLVKVTRCSYGLGTNTCRDETLIKLADGLDALIGRLLGAAQEVE